MSCLCTVYAAAAAAVRGCDARARVRAAGAFLFIFVRAIRATDGKVFFLFTAGDDAGHSELRGI